MVLIEKFVDAQSDILVSDLNHEDGVLSELFLSFDRETEKDIEHTLEKDSNIPSLLIQS